MCLVAGRGKERKADGGKGRSAARASAPPVDASFRGECGVGGRGSVARRTRSRVSSDGAPRAGGRMGRRRHGDSEEGTAFGRGGAPVLRGARQAGQLPGGGDGVAGEFGHERSWRIPTLSSRVVGERPAATPGCGHSGGGPLSAEGGDRSRADRRATGG